MRVPLFLWLVLLPSISLASDKTFENCSVTAWEDFQTIEDFTLGVSPAKVKGRAASKDRASALYNIASTKGIDEAYMSAHASYALCSRDARTGANANSKTEVAFAACARATATRTIILGNIKELVPIEKTKAAIPLQFHDAIDVLYRTANEANLAKAMKKSGDSASACIEQALKSTP
jgi:hypothetical protein